MSSEGRFGLWERLSARERLLVGGLAVLVVAMAIGGVAWWVHAATSDLEEQMAVEAEALANIEKAAGHYIEAKKRCEALESLLKGNSIVSLRIPVNNIARQVTLDDGRKLSDEIRSLEKEVETDLGPLCVKKSKKRKKSHKNKKADKKPHVVRVDQQFEFRNVPMTALFKFLQGIEQSEHLLLVTSLDVRRKYADEDVAQRASVTVATYRLTEAGK